MRDVIVVGGGIMGMTIGLALRKLGRDVTIYDTNHLLSGTRPSGGHIKPSWLRGMPTEDYDHAMEALHSVWEVKSEEFTVRPVGVKTTVYRVDTDVVMATPRTLGEVTGLSEVTSLAPIVHVGGQEERCRLLVVAAGHWCRELLEDYCPPIAGKAGVSFRFQGSQHPFIKPWAPYKQIVCHRQTATTMWIGDGTAVLRENWTEDRTTRCEARCRLALKTQQKPIASYLGVRPYCQTGKDPCLLQQIGKRTWLATGAGKLGTIAAGWAAWRICNASNT